MTHSPTPWRIEGNYLVDANGKPIMGDAGEYDQTADMAQAPRILRAVNAHDDLIAGAKAFAEYERLMDADGRELEATLAYATASKLLKAALAKAGAA